ncbi:GNAT family N-acetyltransferase [Clostridium boliviensis]|uniref:GNAT family N-acetyltransferase n=1 Tax=Clostridium boliviensis TaxID=318465 RepID=A0ABU4GTI9_9CLOT|nr:GNAT family N-acetyltransferase [Clostridium boliviensis]MDW2800941.1 GNAT family N-acetyltransferase [Clostridium boliviensis]
MREYFIKTKRIGFSVWAASDLDLATQLWGESEVTKYICSSGTFSGKDISDRLNTELHNNEMYHLQYWPLFELSTGELIGCCGIRPFKSESHSFELGFHLRKKYWGQGYALEAAKSAIDYSFRVLKADKLYAGHHPQNKASEKLITKLGFQLTGTVLYKPTGLYHPFYELVNQ